MKAKLFKQNQDSQQVMQALEAGLAGELPEESLTDDLRELLATARQLQDLRADLEPRPGHLAAGRHRMLTRLQVDQAASPGKRRPVLGFQLVYQFMLLIVVFFAGAGLVLVSDAALPGDSLYPVRNMTEQLRLALLIDPGRDAALRLQFAQDYLVDSALLLSQDRPSDARQALRSYDRYIVGAGRVLRSLSESEQQQLTNLLADLNQVLGQDVVIMDYLPAY